MDTRKIRELADTTSLSKFNKKINSKRNTTVYDYDRNEKDRKKDIVVDTEFAFN